jgi:hypothetical protein
MATVVMDLWPGPHTLPATNYAVPDIAVGTNFSIPLLRFGTAAIKTAYLTFRAHNYGSGNLTLDLDWYADTATSGDVVWGAALAAMTPDADAVDVTAKSFATAQTVTDTHLGTTGKRPHRATLAIANLDAIAAGDDCVLRITRETAGNTMTGDAMLLRATLSYSNV